MTATGNPGRRTPSRHALTLLALVIVLAASPAARGQQVCGGIAGLPCDPGEFCELDDGECCCDFFGVCTEIPQGCPAEYDPVCGCDGVTYSNRCMAQAASVSVSFPGSCNAPPQEVTGVAITSLSVISWDHEPGSFAYNMYLHDPAAGMPPEEKECLYSGFPETRTLVQGEPAPGSVWMFLVSAVSDAGEGSLGTRSDGSPRTPVAPCTCTLPADVGPCDGICPRWFASSTTGECEQFEWGCCEGNANRFDTREACEAECLDPCEMPAAIGDCAAAIPRWYHNVLTGTCELFAWGGCGGNANWFLTEAGCAASCLP